MRRLTAWLDDRTGYRRLVTAALYERIPGGARWRYVWGSTLVFALLAQLVTGVVLWAGYSANALGAWESVYFIQHELAGGWILRGIHKFMAELMIVLLVVHLMQVLIHGAYRAPREVNFWLGLVMLFLVLALSLTGYLLPWDQKGYWATKVTTSIVSMTPVVGPALQQLLIGGSEYGHHTLTRFLALHAGVLPGALLLLLVGHVYLFRRWGVTAREEDRNARDGVFWPDQALRDAVASLVVMATVMGLVLWTGGAHLGAPADPTEPYAAARPEWYFMFLFQWLKYFPAGWEIFGAQVIPGAIVVLVAAMPFVGRWRLGHRFNLGLAAALLLGVATLTRLAYVQDRENPELLAALQEAEELARRVEVLASSPDGIPPGGGLELLRSDPLTRGPRLFAQNCATCHRYDGHDGLGVVPPDPPEASDLAGFGSREWLTGLLDHEQLVSDRYFGATDHRDGRMARFVSRGLASLTDEQRDQLGKIVVALSAEAELPAQAAADDAAREEIEEGRSLMRTAPVDCTRCHTFRDATEGDVGPVLTGWGSRDWMLGLLHDPADEAYYGRSNDGMPAFGADQLLSPEEMGLIVDWLRGDWYEPEPRTN